MTDRQAISGILEELTIEEVKQLQPNVCVIPVGSTEPHGPALPYGTDSFIVEAACYGAVRLANDAGGRVLCLPPLKISLNNNFRRFPFACRMGVASFMQVLKDLVKMCHADGAARVVIVNSHGGNPEVIQAVLRDLAAEDGPFVCMVSPGDCASSEAAGIWENRSDHAGEEETSMMLHLNPGLVKKDRITANPANRPKLKALEEFGVKFVRPWHLYLPESAGGDARRSSAEKGEIFLTSCIRGLGSFLTELSLAEDNEKFPY